MFRKDLSAYRPRNASMWKIAAVFVVPAW